jgi:hypothetical protein
MVQRFGPIMNEGGAVISLTYNASNRIIPGYGGGMSTAKAVGLVAPEAPHVGRTRLCASPESCDVSSLVVHMRTGKRASPVMQL